MDRAQSKLWAPTFCKVCARRASVVVGSRLLCGDCFFKHSVNELSTPNEKPATTDGLAEQVARLV